MKKVNKARALEQEIILLEFRYVDRMNAVIREYNNLARYAQVLKNTLYNISTLQNEFSADILNKKHEITMADANPFKGYIEGGHTEGEDE